MSTLQRLTTWLDDFPNPIVVKEARQAVRSRFVVAAYLLLLTGLVTGSLAVLMLGQLDESGSIGSQMFTAINAIAVTTCLVVVPILTAARFSAERRGLAADLMSTTTIKPISIVFGKLVVAVMIAIVLFSAAAPFMTVTYLFRGIDLFTIAFVIGVDLIALLAAAQAGVLIAAIPMSPGLKIMAGVVLLPLAIYGILTSIFAISMFGFGLSNLSTEEWIGIAAVTSIALLFVGLMFSVSVALTARETANRAFLPRLYMSAMWLVTLIMALVAMHHWTDPEWVAIWAILWSIFLAFVASIASGERRSPGVRVVRRLPRSRLFRTLAILATSGAATGIIWTILMILLTILATWIASSFATTIGSDDTLFQQASPAFPLPIYMLAYGIVGALLRDRFLAKRTEPAVSVAIAWLLAAVVSLTPGVIAYVLDPRFWDRESWYLYPNPIGSLINAQDSAYTRVALMIGPIFLITVLALAAPWMYKQLRAYRLFEPEPEATGPADPAESGEPSEPVEPTQ